jgi:hypothetical protein
MRIKGNNRAALQEFRTCSRILPKFLPTEYLRNEDPAPAQFLSVKALAKRNISLTPVNAGAGHGAADQAGGQFSWAVRRQLSRFREPPPPSSSRPSLLGWSRCAMGGILAGFWREAEKKNPS